MDVRFHFFFADFLNIELKVLKKIKNKKSNKKQKTVYTIVWKIPLLSIKANSDKEDISY